MGWGTQFTTDVYLSRMSFDSKWELRDKIKEEEESIKSIQLEIAMMVAATPKDIVTDSDTENAVTNLKFKLNELFEWLEETYFLLAKLYQLQQYLEENPDVDIKTLDR
jgi:hypothetical protein